MVLLCLDFWMLWLRIIFQGSLCIHVRRAARLRMFLATWMDVLRVLLVRSLTPHQEEQLLSLLAQSPLLVVAIWTQDVPDTVGYVDVDHLREPIKPFSIC